MECLQPLREQLAEPDKAMLPSLVFRDPAAGHGRRSLLVTGPAEMRTLAVMVGRHTVSLPRWDEPKSVEEISAGLAWYDALRHHVSAARAGRFPGRLTRNTSSTPSGLAKMSG